MRQISVLFDNKARNFFLFDEFIERGCVSIDIIVTVRKKKKKKKINFTSPIVIAPYNDDSPLLFFLFAHSIVSILCFSA